MYYIHLHTVIERHTYHPLRVHTRAYIVQTHPLAICHDVERYRMACIYYMLLHGIKKALLHLITLKKVDLMTFLTVTPGRREVAVHLDGL